MGLSSYFKNRFSKIQSYPFLTQDPMDLLYLVGYSGSNGKLIVFSENDFLFFTDKRYLSDYKEKIGEPFVKELSKHFFEVLVSEINQRSLKSLYTNYGQISYTEYMSLNSYLKISGINLLESEVDSKNLRAIKNSEEIEKLQKAQEITDKALFSVIGLLKEGVSASDISNEIRYLMYKQGASATSFDSMVLFNKDTSLPHGTTGNQKLTHNSVILIDIGAVYDHYCADITRTFFFGTPDQTFKNRYQAVLDVQKQMIEKVKVGLSGAYLDKAARDLLIEYGLEKYFIHSLGHGVGLEVHEYPRISSNSEDSIQENMVFSIEPGIYIENEYGIRIEDLVALTKGNKVKVLSMFPKELIVL